jgi:hypothetical protein
VQQASLRCIHSSPCLDSPHGGLLVSSRQDTSYFMSLYLLRHAWILTLSMSFTCNVPLVSLPVCHLSPSATPQAKNSLKLHSATPGSFVHTAKIRSNEHIKKLFLNFFLQRV